MMAMPKATEPLVATKASAAASTGPVQGAAMMPETEPHAEARPGIPRRPLAGAAPAATAGSCSSKAPNIEAAMAAKTSATRADHQRVLHHAAEGLAGEGRAHAERRVHDGDAEHVEPGEGHGVAPREPALRAPKIETVMGMSG